MYNDAIIGRFPFPHILSVYDCNIPELIEGGCNDNLVISQGRS